jgi:hypothetical protein
VLGRPHLCHSKTLDSAYAETFWFPGAITAARQTHNLALATGEREIAGTAVECIALYESGKPCPQK